MYKALITDLDGTAVAISSDGSDIDLATKAVIQTAINNGKKLTCATGREWELAKGVIERLGFVSPCIIEGGTRIIDPKTEGTIWEKSLEAQVPTRVLEIFKSETSAGLIIHSSDTSRQALTSVRSLPSSLRFLYLLAVEEETAIEISNQINTGSYATAHTTPSWEGGGLVDIHVTHPEATKEHAIQVWQKLEGVTKEETVGMGDSGNDVPVFQSSGYKVAVGNATTALKELADYIAPPVSECALRHVIETILLAS
jgi:HAD superfamily hydrolase (TIGR01484 family)